MCIRDRDDIERKIKYLVKNQNQKYIKLVVHPFVEAFIKKGRWFRSTQWKWYFEYKQKIHVMGSDDFFLTEFRFFDKGDEEIIVE